VNGPVWGPGTGPVSGRVVLVTGGANGIGAATARRLARNGARVVIADVDAGRGAAVANECGGRFVRADVGTVRDNQRAVATAIATFGRLDVTVLNAGIAGRCGLTDFTPRRYRDTMRVNLDGVVYGIEAALPRLRRPADIVVVGSMAGLTGSPDVFYAAGKYALVGLVRSAAPVLAERGLRINVLCPGLVDSPAVAPLRAHGLLLADPDEVAAGIETILAANGTGQSWVIQAGRPVDLIKPPDIPLVTEE
jgi:NAD(P)-dependent dehydrogenase (short-subunit alcohol dehydrogenase family)